MNFTIKNKQMILTISIEFNSVFDFFRICKRRYSPGRVLQD